MHEKYLVDAARKSAQGTRLKFLPFKHGKPANQVLVDLCICVHI